MTATWCEVSLPQRFIFVNYQSSIKILEQVIKIWLLRDRRGELWLRMTPMVAVIFLIRSLGGRDRANAKIMRISTKKQAVRRIQIHLPCVVHFSRLT